MKPLAFHPEARIEFAEAAHYYAYILPALGRRFHDEMDRLLAEAQRLPGTFRIIRKPARRDFSVMHLHRAPGYWKHQLN